MLKNSNSRLALSSVQYKAMLHNVPAVHEGTDKAMNKFIVCSDVQIQTLPSLIAHLSI